MLRRSLLCLVAALAAAPAALASGGSSPPVVQGGGGVLAPGGDVRYVAVGSAHDTAVEAIRVADGTVLRFTSRAGGWGLPYVTYNGSPGGLTADGKTLVLTTTALGNPLRKRSSFVLLNAANLRFLKRIDLKGDFSFDALSPDGSQLYLIQHTSTRNLNRYAVRAYDVERDRLVAGAIADKAQRGWAMQGYPLTRATSTDGRWAYTLYSRPGGYPFVHALDTVRGVAHCIGIPWTGNQNVLWGFRMALRDGGRTLALKWPSRRPYLAIATGTWKISHPAARVASSSFPWWIVALCAGGGAALVAGGFLARSSRRRVGRAVPSPTA